MLSQYLKAALQQAHYEILSDTGEYYGEIPSCRGVNARGRTLEACRDQFAEVLEEWETVWAELLLRFPTRQRNSAH